jgi:hypothetical protein
MIRPYTHRPQPKPSSTCELSAARSDLGDETARLGAGQSSMSVCGPPLLPGVQPVVGRHAACAAVAGRSSNSRCDAECGHSGAVSISESTTSTQGTRDIARAAPSPTAPPRFRSQIERPLHVAGVVVRVQNGQGRCISAAVRERSDSPWCAHLHRGKQLLVDCRCPCPFTPAQCPVESFSIGLKWHFDQAS